MKELKQPKKTVRDIIAWHFGDKDRKPEIERLSGGITNQVFCVRGKKHSYIVRLGADAGKINDFLKEQWAIAKAREGGVPAPEVLEVSVEAAPVPYMISRQSKGTEATYHAGRSAILREMGRFAAIINAIPTAGFGATFEWSLNRLSHNTTWAAYLENELELEKNLETLGSAGMLDPPRIRKLRTTLEGASRNDRAPALNHGDMRLKNVLVDEKGRIACILDWEHCTSNLAPEWELALALHDLSIDEKQDFLEGYGLTGKQISGISPVLKAMAIINYAPAVRHALHAKKEDKIEWYRIRLAGELDLYSL